MATHVLTDAAAAAVNAVQPHAPPLADGAPTTTTPANHVGSAGFVLSSRRGTRW